jgi:hypothetical protein
MAATAPSRVSRELRLLLVDHHARAAELRGDVDPLLDMVDRLLTPGRLAV